MLAHDETATATIPSTQDRARDDIAVGNRSLTRPCPLQQECHHSPFLRMRVFAWLQIDHYFPIRIVDHQRVPRQSRTVKAAHWFEPLFARRQMIAVDDAQAEARFGSARLILSYSACTDTGNFGSAWAAA